jgi:hypothetical protein
MNRRDGFHRIELDDRAVVHLEQRATPRARNGVAWGSYLTRSLARQRTLSARAVEFRVQMSDPAIIVRGSSGVGWVVAPGRDRWLVWLSDGAHALISAERRNGDSRIRVELLCPDLQPYVDVRVPSASPELDAALLEQVAQAAVAGDLPLAPAYRSAWALVIRSTLEELITRAS